MKVIRFENEAGKQMYGVVDSLEESTARIIDGTVPGDFVVTEAKAEIRKLLPPVQPPNIFALGLNYRRHADETGIRYPEIPVMFIKATTTVIGHEQLIILPAAGPDEVDYEGELAVVIGKKAKNVTEEEAIHCIFGYTCSNDVSARDWQTRLQKKQWARGKSFDTFCPTGPWIVTKDEIDNPNNLRIQTRLNGAIVQDSSTSDMIFSIEKIVSSLSRSITLLPGTLILTGTPEGVGFAQDPQVFLKSGDSVSVAIEGIGELRNSVAAEE